MRPLLFFLLLSCALAEPTRDGVPLVERPHEMVDHHSLVGPFISEWWQGGVPHWDFGGSAVVTDKFIRLAPDKQSRLGWLWNDQANYLESWEASLYFRVHSKRNPGADGLALWLCDKPYKYDPRDPQHTSETHLFGNRAGFRGIGIIFDSYDNDGQRDNPVVSVIQGSGAPDQHWQIETDLLNQAAMRCVYEFRNTPKSETVRARIIYSQSKTFQIFLSVGNEKRETYCGQVLNMDIPTGFYFGLTATTGHLADNHDVYGFTVTAAPEEVQHEDKKIYGSEGSKGGPVSGNEALSPGLGSAPVLPDHKQAPENAVPHREELPKVQ
eukprot:TRINITY_DN9296_c0_g1_i1.p1 TRINITY_DN9296_c0_g1~~TRINITY_DN9296_c0_g1_i1.p1  ORF type:complete len:325 (-),score=53.26 TRINITY_DN9296_c0_g1_i1:14-988(-)